MELERPELSFRQAKPPRQPHDQVRQLGYDSWFFLTADYVFGQQLEKVATEFIRKGGGTVRGRVAYPFPGTSDYSSFLLQAQNSGAKVLGLANAGADVVNTIKQAHEFGLDRTMRIAATLMFLSDIHGLGLGLDVAGGLVCCSSYYWDLNDRTRSFNDRVKDKTPGNWPGMLHAGCYAGTLHYLKAVAELGPAAAKADGAATITRMKAIPTGDDCFGVGTIRRDGRKLHPATSLKSRSPARAPPLGTASANSPPSRPKRLSARRTPAPATSTRPDIPTRSCRSTAPSPAVGFKPSSGERAG